MLAELRTKAIELRTKGKFSYSEIQKRLKVPRSTLSYWLKGYHLDDQTIKNLRKRGWSKGEASREKFRFSMKAKKEAKALGVYKKYLGHFKKIPKNVIFVAGLMLYLGEGDKRDDTRIAIANTDPFVITFFIQWLINFMHVSKDALRAELHLYENMDIKKEKIFWVNELGFKQSQFYKDQVRKLRKGSFSYRESYRHGTCKLLLGGVHKKRELMMATKAFLDSYKNMRA